MTMRETLYLCSLARFGAGRESAVVTFHVAKRLQDVQCRRP